MSASSTASSPSGLIDGRIRELGGWRGALLDEVRGLILQADPGVVEEWKWQVPVWSHGGILCTGEAYKAHIKLTFPKGAALDDPDGLFNASLEGNARRAIDLKEREHIDADAFVALIRRAITANRSKKKA